MALFDMNHLDALEQGYRQHVAQQQAATAQAAPQPHQRNLIQALLPAAGATALGLAAAPFTGGLSLLPTLGVIGGASALGGALGEFGAQQSNNEKTDFGNILKEGAISGALGAGGEAFNALRGAKAVSGIAEAAQGAQPAKIGLVEALGKGLKTGASGYGVGAKVAGEQQLTAAGSDAIENTLKALKVPATAPETQARILESRLSNIEGNLSKAYAKANAPITTQEINNLGSNIIGQVAEAPGVGTAGQKFALQEATKLAKAGTSVDKVWQYIKDLERTSINFGKGTSVGLADKDAAARIIRQNVRDFLDSKVPGVADMNGLYHQAKTAQNFILNAARDKGGGLVQRLASSTPAKMAEAKAGAAIETLGKATSRAGKLAAPMAIQTLPRTLGGDYQLNQKSTNDPTMQMMAQTATDQSINPSIVSNMDTQYQTSGNLSSNPFDPANVQASVAQIVANGGTLNDVSKFLSIASALQSLQPPQQKPLNATQQQQANNAVSALGDLGTLANAIQTDPNVVLKDALPGGSLARGLTGTTDYDTAKQNIVDVIARLRSGAAITQDEANRYMSMLPAPGDSQQSAINKLQRLQSLLSAFANPQPASSASDLISALGGAQ